jgi:hypothetical protein
MTGDENFLARWSRRKRDRTRNSRDAPRSEGEGKVQAAPQIAAAGVRPEDTKPLFDAATLPPIESLGARSDIGAFLAAGVPAELTRAALRRAWSIDPAIRDFIGLSENSWDFNVPGGVPGCGPVSAEDVRRLVEQVIGDPPMTDLARPAATTTSDDHSIVPSGGAGLPAPGNVQKQAAQDSDRTADRRDLTRGSQVNIAAQHKTVGRETDPLLPRRSHGGALPE